MIGMIYIIIAGIIIGWTRPEDDDRFADPNICIPWMLSGIFWPCTICVKFGIWLKKKIG